MSTRRPLCANGLNRSRGRGAAAGGSANKGIKMICDSDPKVQHDYVGTAKDSDVRSAQSEMR